MLIREINRDELPDCADVIRAAFATVAGEFDLTEENCPGYAGFVRAENLAALLDRGVIIYGLYERREMIGCVAIEDAGDGLFYLEKLAVLPAYRHNGYGLSLVRFAVDAIRDRGGKRVSIGIMEENTRLRDWYERFGFRHTGTRVFEHLPFTVGFMEYVI